MSKKYMLTVQHMNQCVAYLEFKSENNNTAKINAEHLFKAYKSNPTIRTSGNFSGVLPENTITSHWVSEWIPNDYSCNAWGRPCGGYWDTLKEN